MSADLHTGPYPAGQPQLKLLSPRRRRPGPVHRRAPAHLVAVHGQLDARARQPITAFPQACHSDLLVGLHVDDPTVLLEREPGRSGPRVPGVGGEEAQHLGRGVGPGRIGVGPGGGPADRRGRCRGRSTVRERRRRPGQWCGCRPGHPGPCHGRSSGGRGGNPVPGRSRAAFTGATTVSLSPWKTMSGPAGPQGSRCRRRASPPARRGGHGRSRAGVRSGRRRRRRGRDAWRP